MPRRQPHPTSKEDLKEMLSAADDNVQEKVEDPLSGDCGFGIEHCPLHSSTANDEGLGFADPLLKKAFYRQTRFEKAHNFDSWGDTSKEEALQKLSDEAVFASKEMKVVFENIHRKMKDADKHFHDTSRGNDPVVLSTFEAATIHSSYSAMANRLKIVERVAHLSNSFLSTRKAIIDQYTKTLYTTNYGVQKLLWSQCSQEGLLYGKALANGVIGGEDLAILQTKCNMQGHKIEFLETRLKLLYFMNDACQKHIHDMVQWIHGLSFPGGGEIMQYSVDVAKKLDFRAYRKEIEELKKRAESSESELEVSSAKVKAKSEALLVRFVEVLLHKIRELDVGGQLANTLLHEVYGPLIGAKGEGLEVPPGFSFAQVRPEIDESIAKSLHNSQPATDTATYCSHIHEDHDGCNVDHLRDILSLKTYFQNTISGSHFNDETIVSISVSELRSYKTEASRTSGDLMEAHKELLHQVQQMRKLYIKSENIRHLYDSHMLDCKKSSDRARLAERRVGELADAMIELFGASDELFSGWKMLNDKEKLERLTKAMKRLIINRDEALRKCELLLKKIAQKEHALLEKDTLISKARSDQDQRIDNKNKQLNELSLKLDKKEIERRNAIAEVDKVKAEWQKKLQKAFDKNTALEKHLKAKDEDLNIAKLDIDAMTKDLEKVKKAGKDVVEKYKLLKQERDEKTKRIAELEIHIANLEAKSNARVEDLEASGLLESDDS